jgi:hypothetical protein
VLGHGLTGFGPYEFYNLIQGPVPCGTALPIILLRAEDHLEPLPLKLNITKSQADAYHAGTFTDEIAALAALCLGIKLKPGAPTRLFEPREDMRGRPLISHYRPFLIPSQERRLPVSQVNLEKLTLVQSYPQVSSAAVPSLVRAARLYQDAVWIADAEPETAWLFLVSAVESAAVYWYGIINIVLQTQRPPGFGAFCI